MQSARAGDVLRFAVGNQMNNFVSLFVFSFRFSGIRIAADICVYTNENTVIEVLERR